MKKIFKSLYQRKWIFWPLLIVVVFVGYNAISGSSKVTEELITIGRGDVVETVTATGTVKPKNAASLRFESAGTIAKLNVDVGDVVKAGQLLATLNAGDLRQQVVQAEAELTAALTALENAGQGVSDTGVRSEQALSNAYADALTALGEVLNLTQKVVDAIKGVYQDTALNDEYDQLDMLGDAYDDVYFSLHKLLPTASRPEIETALSEVYTPLLDVQSVALGLVRELSGLRSNTENDAFRASAATALEDINDAIASVVAHGKAIRDASTEVVLDGNTSSASYRSAQAAVETARAAVAIARANLTSATLYAPIPGVIAAKNKSIGEGVSASDQIYYILGDGGLEVTANIPEVDIAKVAVGNAATVKLDAYGDEVSFPVTVSRIDPAETVIDGVATYKTTFLFDSEDSRIRSGMTANIVVSTQKRERVLVVPFRATQVKDGQRIVRLVSGESRVDAPITIGLRGNNGNVEVLSGLSEGDTIVIEKK